MHGTVISMLEYFEIVFRIRGMTSILGGEYTTAQMYFVPSLLDTFDPQSSHPALQYWQGINARYFFLLSFSPSSLFPSLLWVFRNFFRIRGMTSILGGEYANAQYSP
jgi:hypothetical protein